VQETVARRRVKLRRYVDNISVAGRAETTAEASARRVRFINQESAQENVWRRYWRWFVGDFHRERS